MEHKALNLLLESCLVSLNNTHLSVQVKRRLILQLIKDIIRLLQKLVKQFNDTAISTSFLQLTAVLLAIFYLNLNEALLLASWKLAIAPEPVKACSSL